MFFTNIGLDEPLSLKTNKRKLKKNRSDFWSVIKGKFQVIYGILYFFTLESKIMMWLLRL